MKTNFEITGWTKGGDIKANINGELYKFAISESFAGASFYGICYPNKDFYTFISRSKRAANLLNKYIIELQQYIKNNPEPINN